MGDIVNLRTARKAKARKATTATADANRAAFGRKKQEKTATKATIERAAALLDGAKRGK